MHSPGPMLDDEIRRRVDAGDLAGASTLALQGHGPEIFRFLLAAHTDEADAADVFSAFAEGLWRGIGRFDWRCSLRSWLFGVARRSSLRFRRDAGRRAAREAPLEHLEAVAAQVRTQTLSFLRTGFRDRFAELRAALSAEDRLLLMLRVDHALSWNEVAEVLEEGPLDAADLKRAAARLRKRYQGLKAELLAIGRREGLVGRTVLE